MAEKSTLSGTFKSSLRWAAAIDIKVWQGLCWRIFNQIWVKGSVCSGMVFFKSNIKTVDKHHHKSKLRTVVEWHTRCLPVNACPPACSTRKDMGKTSYKTLNHIKKRPYIMMKALRCKRKKVIIQILSHFRSISKCSALLVHNFEWNNGVHVGLDPMFLT